MNSRLKFTFFTSDTHFRLLAAIAIMFLSFHFKSTGQNTFIRHSAIDNLNFAIGYCKTFDKGFIATGQDDGSGGNGSCDFYVEKFDECGEIVWYKRLGTPATTSGTNTINFSEGGIKVVEAVNHDILLVGIGGALKFKDSLVQDNDARIMRLSPNGNVLWERAFGNHYFSRLPDYALTTMELPNGNIACIGFVSPKYGMTYYPYLLMLDAAGNFIYDKVYNGTNDEFNSAWPHGVATDASGNLVISGSCVPSGKPWHNFFLKVDAATGNVISAKIYSMVSNINLGWDWKHGFKKLANGDFSVITTAQMGINLKNMSVVYRMDNNGNVIWSNGYTSNTFMNPNTNPNPNPTNPNNVTDFQNDWSDESYDIYECSNGDLATIGSVNNGLFHSGVTHESGNPYLVTNYNYIVLRRYTSTGILKYSKLFGDGTSVNKARGLIETSDKGFFLNGYTTGFGSGLTTPNYYDPLFIKTDSLGLLHNNCFTTTDNVTITNLTPTVTPVIVNVIDTSNYVYTPPFLNPIPLVPQNDTLCFYCTNNPSFTLSRDSMCPGETFKITNTTSIGLKCNQNLIISGGNVVLLSTAGTDTLSYQINTPGKYYILLKATCGTQNLFLDSIQVMPKPIITLTPSPPLCSLLTATLTPGNAATYTLITNNTTGTTFTVSPSSTTSYSVIGTSLFGCISSNTAVATVTVNSIPTVSFTVNNSCISQPLPFTNNTSATIPDYISSWNWQFNSGANVSNNNTQQPSSITYSTSGVKSITLTAVTNQNCSASFTNTVIIFPQPIAGFTTYSVCEGSPNTFTNQSLPASPASNSVTLLQWDFTNDGTIDNTNANPSFTFPSAGTYTTALITTDTQGCKDTLTKQVTVFGHAAVSFTASNTCFNDVTLFTNTSTTLNPNTGTISNYAYSFGDGTTSALQHPSHTYAAASNATLNTVYNASLTVTTSNGCKDSVALPVNVYALPLADFTADSVCLGMPTHILSSGNGYGNVLSGFSWDLTNDNLVDINGPQNINYTFINAGNSSVTLTVTTSPATGLACKSFTTHNVWVHPLPMAAFTFTNACINAQPVSFNATSSTISAGTNTLFAWAYGDGASANGSVTTHQYNLPVVYNVSLTVTSNKGCISSAINQVEVYQKPLMSISATSLVCLGSNTAFNAVTLPNSGTVNTWLWDLNNSISSIEANGQNTSFVFPAAGTQTVQLVSISDHFCRDTTARTVYINYMPAPQFTVDIPAGCPLPHCVAFTDNTPAVPLPAKINQWKWDFGDGTFAIVNNNLSQNHCYFNSSSSQSAFFTLTLTTITDSNCVNTITKPNLITVYPKPFAHYSIIPESGNVTEPLIHFNNQSVDYTKWWWGFGDRPFIDSVNRNPDHFYENENVSSYQSSLIVANQYYCTDTAFVLVDIRPGFSFYISNAFTPNNDGLNDVFTGMGIGIDSYEMWIFDRWGANIFHTNAISNGWDGKLKNEEIKQDVYIWKVKIKDVLNKSHDYIGHVTLIK